MIPPVIGRFQGVVATRPRWCESSSALKASDGVLQQRVFRGRRLSAAATAAMSLGLCLLRSVPLGKYWRSRPAVAQGSDHPADGCRDLFPLERELTRDSAHVARDHPRAPFAARVTITLQQALGIRARRVAGVISPHGAAVARGHVLTHLFTALDHVGSVPRHAAIRRPSEHRAAGALQLSLRPRRRRHQLARRARPASGRRQPKGLRRESFGSRRPHPTSAHQRAAHRSARQLDASEVLVDLLRAPQPTVSQTLAPPPEPSPR